MKIKIIMLLMYLYYFVVNNVIILTKLSKRKKKNKKVINTQTDIKMVLWWWIIIWYYVRLVARSKKCWSFSWKRRYSKSSLDILDGKWKRGLCNTISQLIQFKTKNEKRIGHSVCYKIDKMVLIFKETND